MAGPCSSDAAVSGRRRGAGHFLNSSAAVEIRRGRVSVGPRTRPCCIRARPSRVRAACDPCETISSRCRPSARVRDRGHAFYGTNGGVSVVIGFDAAALMGGGGGTATLALVLVTVVAVAAGARPDVSRYTDTVWLDRQGPLKGFITKAVPERRIEPVEVYLGVPYASQERFMPPGESPTWCPKANDGSFNHSHCQPMLADHMKPVCPQRKPDMLVANTNKQLSAVRQNYLNRLTSLLGNQSEDCLYLNIYVPHGKSNGYIKILTHNDYRMINWKYI